MTSVRSEYGVDKVVAGEDYLLHYNPAEKFDGTSRLVIALHGHNGTASQLAQNHAFVGRHAAALVRSGRYMVLAVSAGGGVAWSNPASQTSIAAGVTYGASRGAKSGKYGLLGYSMGGFTALNRVKRDAANVAGALLWAPLTDLAWANSSNGAWATEIATAFGSYAATAGYRVSDEPATYSATNVPIRIVHATDDATVPYSQSTSFVAATSSPNITVRTPAITGGHTGLFKNVSDEETIAFFDSLSWS